MLVSSLLCFLSVIPFLKELIRITGSVINAFSHDSSYENFSHALKIYERSCRIARLPVEFLNCDDAQL